MKTVCPYCAKANDCASGVDTDARPKPGDVSVCIDCAGVAVFTQDGARKPTTEERAALAADPDLSRLVAKVVAGIGRIRRAEWN